MTRCVPHFIGLYCSSLCGLEHGSQEGAKKEGRKEERGGTALGLAKRRLIEAAVTVRAERRGKEVGLRLNHHRGHVNLLGPTFDLSHCDYQKTEQEEMAVSRRCDTVRFLRYERCLRGEESGREECPGVKQQQQV